MTPEQSAWDGLRPVLQQLGLDPHRVENVLGEGTPDVDYAHGNIELKVLPKLPARAATRIKVPKFRGTQAGWLFNRWKAGGLSWLMVKCQRDWFLFDGGTAMDVWLGMTEELWRARAACIYPTGASRDTLGAWLRWQGDALPSLDRAVFLRLELTRP